MVNLKKWAKNHTIYLKIEPGSSVTCKFIGAEEFVDRDNEDREKIRYHVEVDGSEKQFESQSVGLAAQMAEVKIGDWITISKEGQGRATRYTIKIEKPPA